KSPCSQSAPRPYGLSTVSLAAIGAGAIGAGAAEAASVVVGAAPVASTAEAACAAAVRGDMARTQSANVASVAAKRAEIGWLFRMWFFLSWITGRSFFDVESTGLTPSCRQRER